MTANAILVKNHIRYNALFCFSIAAMLFSLVVDTPREIVEGFVRILQSPSHLLTDYMAVGGVGATFFNAGLLSFLIILSLWRRKQLVTGPIVAAVFTAFGFAFFGKNIFNSLPITIGVYLYSKFEGVELNTLVMNSIFGTALGPAVSYICFGIGLPFGQGLVISYLVGIGIGMVLPPLSRSVLKFHEGYTLYNMGFTCGIIGLFIQGVLRSFDLEVNNVSILGDEKHTAIAVFVYGFFVLSVVAGYFLNGKSFVGFSSLLKNTGRAPSDFAHIYGHGLSLVNMGLLGILYTTFVLLYEQTLNGPILGGIFTIYGFGIFGKHVRNVASILLGTVIAYTLNIYPPTSVGAMVTILFATNLAPISGEYGFVAGMVAGFAHVSIVSVVGVLHGGLNLYNNGFSGGFVAAALVPIFESIRNSVVAEKLRGRHEQD